ncbi:hypothetical protein A3709_03575 [Halioglobus sp. HI00S01]|uniref:PilW family protein n=1 Tax=Halioglobus sp. HI00S01 TaxID=1822214 RepID=UPI0007C396B3|nr:PilW family protein [Halioglobus sp. HI00S01]KZX56871.1 hypothetical protein A3709_03575 [Halioglobus sp. HI00S01]
MSNRQQQGFSLIEFMVAMLLGLIVIAGAASVYLASKQSLTEGDQVAGISENGQFALQMISYSAKHVGFFGGAYFEDITEDGSLTDVTGDCTGPAAAYDTEQSLVATTATSATVFGCITDALPGSDVLVIKNVIPDPIAADPNDASGNTFPIADIDSETTYLVTNNENGILVDGADTMPDIAVGSAYAMANAWPYNVEIYYVRNNPATPNTTLSRKVLTWNGSEMAMNEPPQDLVQGVENMRFLFSFNTGIDGTADTMAADDPNNVGASGWDQATSMQAYILLRAENDDYDYTNDKTYTLGDRVITPDDTFRRVLLHADITLRNPRIILRGAGT